MSGADYDIAVIGAGVVGCAIASRLAAGGSSVLLLERETREGTGTTSRNSGVIHAGLYYQPGSLKARTCVAGAQALYRFAQDRQIPHARVGKLVVARQTSEVPALEALAANAEANGVEGCALLGPAAVATREPSLPPMAAALWSPNTGIVDPHALTAAYLADALRHEADWVPSANVDSVVSLDDHGFSIRTARGEVAAQRVINSAGLYADEIASMLGLSRSQRTCRGDYFRLRSPHQYRHLVYPIRRPNDPGLGVHLTLGLDGSYRLGPDWTWDVEKTDFGSAEHKLGFFADAGRRLLGPLADSQLSYDGCGIRPKLSGPGEPLADFEIVEQPTGALHLLGIESPGLTAALALADEVAMRL